MILDENFSYGYDDQIYNLRSSSDSQFNCYYTKSSRNFLSFKEEAILVCKKISDYCRSVNKIPMVLLSGGLDSEVVVRAFLESGREFKTISNKFNDDLNSHEIFYIEQLKSDFNFEHQYHEIDIIDFYKSQRCNFLIDVSKCTVPEMLPTMELIDHVYNSLGAIPVLGNGDFYVSKDEDGESVVWNYIEYEYILAWIRFCLDQNITAANGFFQYTPEIVLAMGRDPLMEHLFKNFPEGKKSSRSKKYLVYKKNWIDIKLRPKFHGGEKLEEICKNLRNSVCQNYMDYTTLWKMPVDQFLNMLDNV